MPNGQVVWNGPRSTTDNHSSSKKAAGWLKNRIFERCFHLSKIPGSLAVGWDYNNLSIPLINASGMLESLRRRFDGIGFRASYRVWDGQLFWAGDDGSHRFAALYIINTVSSLT
jgi:hypothetical protein